MLYHGLEKWLVIGVSEFAQTMGLPMALAIIVAASEVAAGVALLAGVIAGDWITRAGAALACPVLLGAVFYVHWGQWHFLPTATHPMGGMAFQITLLGVAIYLLIRGNEV
jgi:putative oxidoreductase